MVRSGWSLEIMGPFNSDLSLSGATEERLSKSG
jgi:hypothetical protein